MSNDSAIISLVAETHIHVGVGQSTGALDLPVARERTTDYPFIPGSGVKGAMKVWAGERAGLGDKERDDLFGKEGQAEKDEGSSGFAGHLLCSDARLLLLPVRCMSDAFKWVTCPAILKRFARDCQRADVTCDIPGDFNVEVGKYLGADTQDGTLGLEEREFKKASNDEDVDKVIKALAPRMVPETDLKQRLVILSDMDFGWFARYALPVMARNKLDDNKIVVGGALWYEESLAPDTVMYLLLGERKEGAVKKVRKAMTDAPYVQIGGNETIGQGWFNMKPISISGGGG